MPPRLFTGAAVGTAAVVASAAVFAGQAAASRPSLLESARAYAAAVESGDAVTALRYEPVGCSLASEISRLVEFRGYLGAGRVVVQSARVQGDAGTVLVSLDGVPAGSWWGEQSHRSAAWTYDGQGWRSAAASC